MDQSPTLPPAAAATAERPALEPIGSSSSPAASRPRSAGSSSARPTSSARRVICLLGERPRAARGRARASARRCSSGRSPTSSPARSTGSSSRPDLMPADIIGTNILVEEGGSRVFRFQPGPVFANLVLADEINRATPKTQSALLEAMQEHQVTVARARYQLAEPFFVLATQNPLEMEGTYPLPEAQLDRFMFKVHVPFPTEADLALILERTTGTDRPAASVAAGAADVLAMQHLARAVPIAPHVTAYAVALLAATHPDQPRAPGARPRVRPLRRLAPRGAGAGRRRQGAGAPRRALQRVRRGPAGRRPPRPPPPDHPQLRGRGRGDHHRRDRPHDPRQRRPAGRRVGRPAARAMERPTTDAGSSAGPARPSGGASRVPAVRRRPDRLRRGVPAPPRAPRGPRPAAGPGRPQGRPAQRQARPVRGVRRLPRLQPGRRPAPARLERLRPPREALRQALHRGGGPDGHLPRRRLGLDGPRDAGQARLRQACGRGPRLHRPGRRGSRRAGVAGRAGRPPAGRAARLRAGVPPPRRALRDPPGRRRSPTSWPPAGTPWPR